MLFTTALLLARTSTPTPTPTVGNEIKPANKAAAETALASASAGDVINCNHAGYTPSAGWNLDITTTYAAGGVNLITHPSEPARVRIVNRTAVNLELTLSTGSGDSVVGSSAESTNNDTVYMQNSSGICISSSKLGKGYCSVRAINCSDITLTYCVLYGSRDDLLKSYSGITRIQIRDCLFRDNTTASRAWCKFDGSNLVLQGSDPGGGYVMTWDPNHGDPWQSFGGVTDHFWVYRCDFKGYMQGVFLTDDISGSQSYGLVEECRFQCAVSYALMITTGNNIQVRNNTFLKHSDPLAPTPAIYLARAGGTGTIRGYGNALAPGMVPNVPAPIVLDSPTPTGDTVTGPTPPSFTGTLATVGGLTVPRTRPSYTDYAGLPVMDSGRDPFIVGPTSAPYAVGAWLNVIPEGVQGYYYGCEATYRFRWKLNGSVVRGPITGLSGAKYQTTGAGAVTAEVDTGDGIWRATAAVTVS